MKTQKENISREMIYSFMEDLTPKQLEKLANYACKIYSNKQYKINKKKKK